MRTALAVLSQSITSDPHRTAARRLYEQSLLLARLAEVVTRVEQTEADLGEYVGERRLLLEQQRQLLKALQELL